jgi:hypothetical protein
MDFLGISIVFNPIKSGKISFSGTENKACLLPVQIQQVILRLPQLLLENVQKNLKPIIIFGMTAITLIQSQFRYRTPIGMS